MRKKLLILFLLAALLVVLILIIPRFIPRTEEPVLVLPVKEDSTEETEEVPVLSLQEELPGEYILTALFSDELRLSETDLAGLHERGIPLGLTIRDDGTAYLSIFDAQAGLEVNTDAMYLFYYGQSYPFFYENGILTVWDSGNRAVFKKAPD